MDLRTLLSVLALVSAGAPDAGSTAQDLARRVDQRQRSVVDLTADFVQTYRSGLLGRDVVESGRLSLKRPGRMRWEYRKPERKTFVADGRSFYFYVPADRQVIVRKQAGDQGVAVRLLSGSESLLSEFTAALVDGGSGVRRLRLTPRRPDPEVERIEVDVDSEYRIRAISVRDLQGNQSRFELEQIRENVGLDDRLFRFQIPAGVEVLGG